MPARGTPFVMMVDLLKQPLRLYQALMNQLVDHEEALHIAFGTFGGLFRLQKNLYITVERDWRALKCLPRYSCT